MRWIYGKHDWSTMERGLENCFLMTNGLGGFSSLTMTGAVSRIDHAVLMACTKAPNHRFNLVHRLKECVETESGRTVLSCQEFADGNREEGYRYLSCFSYEDTPVWQYQAGGAEVRKEMGLARGRNCLALRYQIVNRGREACRLLVTPFFQFTRKGVSPEETQRFARESGRLSANGLTLYFRTDGEVVDMPEETERYAYRYDARDGRSAEGLAWTDHMIVCRTGAGETGTLEIIYETEPSRETADMLFAGIKDHRRRLAEEAGFRAPAARMLSESADQFIARRESTGGYTVLAGYPFFEDWGRDTMVALPGLCIATGRYGVAESILRTFAEYERDGLMPNLFPEGGSEPQYNTADAALLFLNCVWLYYEATGNEMFVREMYPVMERIVDAYIRGTAYGIHMDPDGLIMAGEGLAQVTWMDVRAGDILPTPRHGKPVEINAYWYNALRIMERFQRIAEHGASEGDGGGTKGKRCAIRRSAADYAALAEQAKKSFAEQFWMEEKGYLKDVISGTPADVQMRCNQILAVSMPFSILDKEKERRIVDAVYEKLYTPYGLRTLAQDDPEFHPRYGGSMYERDMAYHQGTVWVYPLGAYYLAYLKVHGGSGEAAGKVREDLQVLESAMREGCIAQLPEIYDGENPSFSRGCFAQAWSVGEILRVYKVLETGLPQEC